MSENNSSPLTVNDKALVVPALGKLPALSLDMVCVRVAETRYIEAKNVNPATYADLEHIFNESYRDLKRHVASIGWAKDQADKELRAAAAEVILGTYATYLEGKPKAADTSHMKDAFLMKDEHYLSCLDRVNQLKALESNFDGKIKVVENVCRYMRKKMDLLIRSGNIDTTVYNTIGRK